MIINTHDHKPKHQKKLMSIIFTWQNPLLPSNLVHSMVFSLKCSRQVFLHSPLLWTGTVTSRRLSSAAPLGFVFPHPRIRHLVWSWTFSPCFGSSIIFTFLFRATFFTSWYTKKWIELRLQNWQTSVLIQLNFLLQLAHINIASTY